MLVGRVRSTSSIIRSGASRNGSTSAGQTVASAETKSRRRAPSRTPTRSVSLLQLIPNILRDQKRIWLFPKTLLEGKHWRPTLIFLLVMTGSLLLVDPHDPGYFRHTAVFHQFNIVVSGQNAADAMWVVTLSFLGLGIVRRDSYMWHTVLYAIEAVAGSELLTQILKGVDRRLRPQDVHSYHHFLNSWFQDRGAWYSGPGSFPSGHMIAAISLATIFALRYSERRWVPWTAYSLAVVVGFSRITLLSHFPSDVFAGGVFGYAISRYVVLSESPSLASENKEDRELPRVEALN
jgi:membrane-associated phospholipid phosphatase